MRQYVRRLRWWCLSLRERRELRKAARIYRQAHPTLAAARKAWVTVEVRREQ